MQVHRAVNAAIAGCLILLSGLTVVRAEAAEIFYDIAVKGSYEDNVVGLLSDRRGGTPGVPAATGPGPGMMNAAMGPRTMNGHTPQDVGSQSESDTSLNLFADIGASTEIAPRLFAFLIGSAQHTFYNTFTELDLTTAAVSAGVNKRFGENLSARLAMSGGIKRYRDSTRDSSAFGPGLLFKEQLTPSFWLKESYYYEQNDADSAVYTYTGNSVSIWAGYLILAKTRLLLGYNYLEREFDEPAGFKVTANTVSVGVEQALAERWYIDGQYDHESSDSRNPATSATDNIVSIGLRYSY